MASRDKQFLDDDIFNYDDEPETEIEDSVSRESVEKKIIEDKPSPVIPTKPILEVKQMEENPYAEKYKKTPSTKPKKKRQLKQDIAVKKLISISQKNMKVVDILKNIPDTYPSDSEYICQAIIEKYERETEFKNADIKSLVRNALEELVGEKYIIMKGSSDVQVASTPTYSAPNTPVIQQSSINQAISSQEEEEKESLLLGIIDDMDDD